MPTYPAPTTTPQQYADVLLATWQRRRALPPAMRLADNDNRDAYDATLDAVRVQMGVA